jgi:hypothetical protein
MRILSVGSDRRGGIAMEANNSDVENRKEEAQKMLCQLDDLEEHYETVETDVFDRKASLAALQNGEFSPPSGTIFEAIFQELKRKEQREKNRHSFSSLIPRLNAHDRSK